MAGKGSRRRVGKPGAYERGYEAIDWSKGRKPAASHEPTVGEILVRDYATQPQWIIPDLSEVRGLGFADKPARCGGRDGCTNPPEEPHTCPYAEEINGDSDTLCTCCRDCTHECAQDI